MAELPKDEPLVCSVFYVKKRMLRVFRRCHEKRQDKELFQRKELAGDGV
jgi:hypothetical protein